MRFDKTRHPAFTLVEMLIAMALTLILVYAIAEFYSYVGTKVRDSRAIIEMGGQLRAAGQQLHDDLNSLTLRPTPWIDPAASPGYFSVYEGPGSDANPDPTRNAANGLYVDANNNQVPDLVENSNITTLFGDGDDVLAMTIRAKDIPFQGRYNGNMQQSQYAEVIWFTSFTDVDGNNTWNIGADTAAPQPVNANEMRFLCRRQLLIRPDLGQLTSGTLQNALDFWQNSDISARIVQQGGNYLLVANSLQDLSRRENRFACGLSSNGTAAGNYPYGLDLNPNRCPVNPSTGGSAPGAFIAYSLQGNFVGEDRVLSNVLAFDARVYDAGAPVFRGVNSTTAVVPGDFGYVSAAGSAMNLVGYGAWVDMYYNQQVTRDGGTAIPANNTPPPQFAAAPANFPYGIWDTWPTTYEFNPGNGQAFNGLDDNNQYGVDDATERQTQPPYATPLRGVQVRIRIYEPQTRQMRQVTVGADFVGE